MEALIQKLKVDFPELTFTSGPRASWSPANSTIYYPSEEAGHGSWTLLHEVGHALLGHASYSSDVNLLQKESAAWQAALELAPKYGLLIANDHIQDCLDTYRDWLHKRSSCPVCGHHGLQATQSLYSCPNCQNTWKVSSARFCRPYRLKSAEKA